jgi:intracellular septation protein
VTRKINPYLKGALDFGPIVLFFAGYRFVKDQSYVIGGQSYSGFIVMAAGFAVITLLTTLALWFLTGKISRMQILTLVLIVVMAGFTLWFKDERFFKMKPTLIYALFAGILGVGLVQGKSYLRLVMEEALPLQAEGWMVLTRRIAGFFAVLAVLNEVVWRNFSTEIWVDFKTFGLTFAMFAFFLTQARVFERYGIPEAEDETKRPD